MIPREEISAFHHRLNAAFLKADPTSESVRIITLVRFSRYVSITVGFEIMGSYRRGEKMSSDIDLVAWHE
jgi:DNA polymerase/3'-5' exonuclease PolX